MSNLSSRPPAGVPKSGSNTKYAIVAAALLLAIGAIVLLRRSSDRETAPAPPPSASVALTPPPPSNPKVEDIPPPPPAEEEKPEGGGGPRVIYVQTATPCESKCVGTPTPELEQALKIRGQQARRCYNEALARDPTLHGHLVFDVRVSQGGNVCSVNVTSNDMGSPKVANCAAHILGGATYPAPRGGCIDGQVPLNFVAAGQ